MITSNCSAVDKNSIAFAKVVSGNAYIFAQHKIEILKPTYVYEEDVIITGKDSILTILFNDGSRFKILSETTIQFYNKKLVLKKGNIYISLKKQGKNFVVDTPVAMMGVLGTEFSVKLTENDDVEVALFEGSITVSAKMGLRQKVKLFPDQSIIINQTGYLMPFSKIPEATTELWEEIDEKLESIGISTQKEDSTDCYIIPENDETSGSSFIDGFIKN